MKDFIGMVALVGFTLIATPAGAMPRQYCDCDCRNGSILPAVLDQLSQPVGDAMDSETGDVRWEHAQAIAARDREYSRIEHQHNDQDYRLASPLIDAQYDISSAEIAQVAKRQVKPAIKDFNAARAELDKAIKIAHPTQRQPLTALRDSLKRTDLVTTLCHGQSRGEDRYQYERFKASLRREIRTL